jgi:hypothetical protein
MKEQRQSNRRWLGLVARRGFSSLFLFLSFFFSFFLSAFRGNSMTNVVMSVSSGQRS